jgi:MFS superfamily sulfate permease-like transporter
VEEAGGRSQIAALAAAVLVLLLVVFGGRLLGAIPLAALAGVLLSVALRIARPSTFVLVLRQTPAEFALILATMAAIVMLPIQTGVATGIALSVLHGIWTITRTRIVEFEKVPGTSVWWPPTPSFSGEYLPDVTVLGFPAPLSFLNADEFRNGMIAAIERDRPKLLVFEASSVAEIDFTAAQVLIEIISRCHDAGVTFVIARLTSLRALQALRRFGITDRLGAGGIFRSVDDAIRAMAPQGTRADVAAGQPDTR